MKLQKYFKDKILKQKEIKNHFNKNFKVITINGTYHLKIFSNDSFEIREWINGEPIKEWNEENIMLVCKELIILHNLKVNWKQMIYKENKIKNTMYQDLLSKYKNDEWVACHNDLNKDNIIISAKKAIFIDFEFKRINNKYWDIANIINEDKLIDKHMNLFLKHYSGLKKEKLKDFIFINKVFNNYWGKCRKPIGNVEIFVETSF